MDANAAPSLGTDSLLSRPIGPLVSPPMPWNTFPCLTSECRMLAFSWFVSSWEAYFSSGSSAAKFPRPESGRAYCVLRNSASSSMFEAELGGWWLAETSAGVVVLPVSAWFRWFTRSGLVASAGCCVSKVRIWFLQSQNIPFTKTLGDTWWFPFCRRLLSTDASQSAVASVVIHCHDGL